MNEIQESPLSTDAALLEAIDRLSIDEAQALLQASCGELIQRCAIDGLQYLRFVQTRDEADPLHAVKPFPIEKAYTSEVWKAIDRSPVTVVAKSRQLMMSWIVVIYCTWWARFKPHQAIFYQMQKKEDAVSMVCEAGGKSSAAVLGRCQFIERNLPPWLRQPVKENEGLLVYPNGSKIQALAGGADQVRGKVASIVVLDEMGFHLEARGEWTAVAPLLQKGAKVIVVSTPNGREHIFADLFFGFSMRRAA